MHQMLAVLVLVLSLAAPPSPVLSSDQKIVEYLDNEYGYAFNFPSDWKTKKVPEANEFGGMRVVLQGPKGITASVTVAKIGQGVTRKQFEDNPNRNELTEGLMNLTIEQVYKKASKDIKATKMVVAEKKIIPSESGIKFYVSTLYIVGKNDIPMTLAGIHIMPFSKDYLINFTMITFLDGSTKQEQETFEYVFKSFRLIGERPL